MQKSERYFRATFRKLLKEILSHTRLGPLLFPRDGVHVHRAPAVLSLPLPRGDATSPVPWPRSAARVVGPRSFSTTTWSPGCIDKTYYAIDTFSGFMSADIGYEVQHRGKNGAELAVFDVNKQKWFDKTHA